MNFLRNHIISRIICFAFALHILNVSIDSPDAQPDSIAEDLSVNDIETMTEFVLETVLNIDNAIAEHDEPDESDGSSLGMKKMDFYFQRAALKAIAREHILPQPVFSDYKVSFYSSRYANVLIQPPEA